jgi:acetyl-CoA synthetase
MKATLDAALADAPTVQHVVVVRRIGAPDTPLTTGRDHWWHDLVAAAANSPPQRNRRAPKTC